MKKLIIITAIVLPALLFINGRMPEQDWTDCLVKYKSEWGEATTRCNGPDTYKVYLRNSCTESIDVLVCVQEADKSWRPFSHNGMAPSDSMVGYACKGTGKYLWWARKAGDMEILFPTIDEVNEQYPD